MTHEEFQTHVISSLATLNAQMKELVGNGQPGRISKIEAEISALQASKNRIYGIAIGISGGISCVAGFVYHFLR